MKKMKKKWMIVLVTLILAMTMAIPALAEVSRASQGALKPGRTYVTAGIYKQKFKKSKSEIYS